MMMMSGRIRSCCVALLLTLTSVSAVGRTLNSVTDLKSVGFGQSVPKCSLLLLHWFANIVNIDRNNVIHLTFDPDGDYGSHLYHNNERVLETLQNGYQYYTLGNIHQGTSVDLPDYIVQSDEEESNRARIIFRVREQNVGWIIDQVYITQHYETSEHRGTEYDPEHTYKVTTCLLRAIRRFSLEGNNINSLMSLRDRFGSSADDSQIRQIRNTWRDLACLGLFLFIVMQEKYSPPKRSNSPQPAASDFVVDIPESRQNAASDISVNIQVDPSDDITLKVTTGKGGKARITWSNVPSDFLNRGVMVALYKNDQEEKALTDESIGNRESGSYDTSVPLNEGLQVRLHEMRKQFFFLRSLGEEKYRSSEFKNPQAVDITGYDANLQLFAKDSRACARLRVKKSFHDWRSEFKKAWVGFYSSEDKATKNYKWWQWQWATKFKANTDFQNSTHDVYEYKSGMAIAPGVQIRFILQDEIEKARTPAWRE